AMALCDREDWTLFRSLQTLGQKAGVPVPKLARLVVKELIDNALDAGGACGCRRLDGGVVVHDDGPGLEGDDAAAPAPHPVHRPLASSKLVRLPTRGALGNGLRVVAGAVLASGGALTVRTTGRALRLEPQAETGQTRVLAVEPWAGGGTEVEVHF